jgi:hypothetical protein
VIVCALIAVGATHKAPADQWAYCEPSHSYSCLCGAVGRVWVASERPIRNVCELGDVP